jgi:hypothetical protein
LVWAWRLFLPRVASFAPFVLWQLLQGAYSVDAREHGMIQVLCSGVVHSSGVGVVAASISAAAKGNTL